MSAGVQRPNATAGRDVFVIIGACSLFTLATPAWADPPPLVKGPVVQLPDAPNATTRLWATDRGLSVSFTTLSSLVPSYSNNIPLGLGATGPQGYVPFKYGADTATVSVPATVSGTFTQSIGFAYTLTETNVTKSVQVGGGITAIVRANGTVLGSATAATSAQAQSLALATATAPRLNGRALRAPIISAGGVTESVSESTARLLTGRDTYLTDPGIITFGPGPTLSGNMGRCNSNYSSCEGGVTLRLGGNDTDTKVIWFQDLYVTNTTTRTITSSGTVYLDFASAANGFGHPAAQTVGFEISNRFMGRLLSPQSYAPLGDSGISVFVEGTGQTGDLDGAAGLASSSFGFTGLRGGLSSAISDTVSLGAVIEGGHWGWSLHDKAAPEHLAGDSVRGGAFLDWNAGGWRLNLGAFAGSQQVRSTGSSTQGGGTSVVAYDADVYGAGGEAGYPVAMGNWTLTPLVGISWLGWRTPTFTETGGLAPLTVAAASRDQFRTSVGLGLDQLLDLGDTPLAVSAFAKLLGIYGDRTGLISASDGGLSAPGSFAIAGPGSGGVGGEIGAHAALSIAPHAAITLGWSSLLANHATSHAGTIGIRVGL